MEKVLRRTKKSPSRPFDVIRSCNLPFLYHRRKMFFFELLLVSSPLHCSPHTRENFFFATSFPPFHDATERNSSLATFSQLAILIKCFVSFPRHNSPKKEIVTCKLRQTGKENTTFIQCGFTTLTTLTGDCSSDATFAYLPHHTTCSAYFNLKKRLSYLLSTPTLQP